MGAKDVWDMLDEDQHKQVSFWLLNRYVSAVQGNRDKQELAVFKTNEYYNKNYMSVSKEQKLMWQLLCMSGNTGRSEYHPWIGFKKRSGDNKGKTIKLLSQVYPHLKDDEIELLASISTKKELKGLAEEHGIEGVKL